MILKLNKYSPTENKLDLTDSFIFEARFHLNN